MRDPVPAQLSILALKDLCFQRGTGERAGGLPGLALPSPDRHQVLGREGHLDEMSRRVVPQMPLERS